jgi:hypothetical protein
MLNGWFCQVEVSDERPYRNKLELVSRMVISQDGYSAIKDKVLLGRLNL